MEKEETLNRINNELKTYINESGFISIKCRNKLLKMFADEFNIVLDIDNYKNVDLKVLEDFTISYRNNIYKPDSNITNIEEFIEKYNIFKESADKLIKKREIDFEHKSNLNNISNLIIFLCLIIAFISIIILGIIALYSGHYYDCLWFIVVVGPWLFPKFKESFINRFIRAKNYLKRVIKRIK